MIKQYLLGNSGKRTLSVGLNMPLAGHCLPVTFCVSMILLLSVIYKGHVASPLYLKAQIRRQTLVSSETQK